MKNLFILCLLITFTADAQITHEHTYPTINSWEEMRLIHLSNAGYKYSVYINDSLILYNLNHSVYQIIQVPPAPPMSSIAQTAWISDELFNTNSSDIEYMMIYDSPIGIAHISVFDQTGAVLFSRDSFYINLPGAGYEDIQHTTGGVKMLLHDQFSDGVAVYSLPGVLPCEMCDNGVISGALQMPSGPNDQQQQLPSPYPNPSNHTTTIPYQLPVGLNTGELIIYDLLGQEVKRYNVTSAFASLEISIGELAAGTYSYALQTSAGVTTGNKFVVAE